MSEPEITADTVRMTGALFAMLIERPGVTLTLPEGLGNEIEIGFDPLPGRYRITIEPA